MHFSNSRVTNEPDASSLTMINIATANPAELVEYLVDKGQLRTQWLRPMQMLSPPMLTAFPRLSGHTDDHGNDKPPEIDITMRGAGELQEKFKSFMDKLDNHLLNFMQKNQALLGKAGLTKEGLASLQRPLFKTRISAKTGKQYPDAMVLRFKGRDGTPLIVVGTDGQPIEIKEDGSSAICFNSIVRVSLRFSGSYCKAGFFGNSFELTGVQLLGQAPSFVDEPIENPFTLDTPSEKTWPSLSNA